MTDTPETPYWTSPRVVWTAVAVVVLVLVLFVVGSALLSKNDERQQDKVDERMECVTRSLEDQDFDEDC